MPDARFQRSERAPLFLMLAGMVLLLGCGGWLLWLRSDPAGARSGGVQSFRYRGIHFDAVPPGDGVDGGIDEARVRLRLLGSMHWLRPEDHPLPVTYTEAFDWAEMVVFELASAPDNGDAGVLQRHTAYADGSTLRDHLSASVYQRSMEALRRSGIEPASMARKQPWVLAQSLAASVPARAGFRKELGVESVFRSLAATRGKAIAGLETVEQQLGVFSALGDARQEKVLVQTLQEIEDNPDYGMRGVAAWKSGDTEAVAALREATAGEDPALARALFGERHARWIEEIDLLVASGRRVLVIVGAAHLCGEGSLIDLLVGRGYLVRQR